MNIIEFLSNGILIQNIKELTPFENKYLVYFLYFPNNKVYCGYSHNIKRRWRNENEYSNQQLVFRAINKYKWENVKKYIVYFYDDKESALQKEKELIEKFDLLNPEKGYNSVAGGGEPPHGKQYLSEEGYKKLQKNGKRLANEIWSNPEKAAYVIQRMKEENHKARMQMTPEQRKKSFGEHNLGNKAPNAKPIYQLDLNTEAIIAQFESAGIAAKTLGDVKYGSNIRSVANGKRKSAYGFKWRWVENDNFSN